VISDFPANRSIPSFSSKSAKATGFRLCHRIGQNHRFPALPRNRPKPPIPAFRQQRHSIKTRAPATTVCIGVEVFRSSRRSAPTSFPASNLHVPRLPPSSEAPPALQPSRRSAATSFAGRFPADRSDSRVLARHGLTLTAFSSFPRSPRMGDPSTDAGAEAWGWETTERPKPPGNELSSQAPAYRRSSRPMTYAALLSSSRGPTVTGTRSSPNTAAISRWPPSASM